MGLVLSRVFEHHPKLTFVEPAGTFNGIGWANGPVG